MSLLGPSSIMPNSAGGDTLEVGAAATPDQPGVTFLLVYNDPDAPVATYGRGWSLVSWHGTRRLGSLGLDAHGAGAYAGTSVAKAVAVRVLVDQGIAVDGWSDGAVGDASLRSHRAVPGRTPRAAGAAPGRAALDLRWRRGRSPGH